MKGFILVGTVVCLLAGAVAGAGGSPVMQVPKAEATDAVGMEEPEQQYVKRIFTVFEGATATELSGLTVWDGDGNILTPETKTDSAEPAYGIYYLVPGEYFFSYEDEEPGRKLSRVVFELTEDIDEALISFDDPPHIFGVQASGFGAVNPVRQEEAGPDIIPRITIEEKARSLENFSQVIESRNGQQ